MSRGIGCGALVIDPIGGTPIGYCFESKFTIVGNDFLKFVAQSIFHSVVPSMKGGGCIQFELKRKTLNIASVIIDDIHEVKMTGFRSKRHRATKVYVDMLLRPSFIFVSRVDLL